MAKTDALFLTKPAKETIETIDTRGWKNLELLIYYKEPFLRLTVCCMWFFCEYSHL